MKIHKFSCEFHSSEKRYCSLNVSLKKLLWSVKLSTFFVSIIIISPVKMFDARDSRTCLLEIGFSCRRSLLAAWRIKQNIYQQQGAFQNRYFSGIPVFLLRNWNNNNYMYHCLAPCFEIEQTKKLLTLNLLNLKIIAWWKYSCSSQKCSKLIQCPHLRGELKVTE